MKYILKLKIIDDGFITKETRWTYLSQVNRQLLDGRYPLIGNTIMPSQALKFDTLRDIRKIANLLLTREKRKFTRPIKETQIVPIPLSNEIHPESKCIIQLPSQEPI